MPAVQRSRISRHLLTLPAREPENLRFHRLPSGGGAHPEYDDPEPMIHELEKSSLCHGGGEVGECLGAFGRGFGVKMRKVCSNRGLASRFDGDDPKARDGAVEVAEERAVFPFS